MSQIVGSKRQSTGISSVIPNTPASVDRIDHKSNGALATTFYAGAMGRRIDVAGGGITYIGDCAPGHTGDTYDEPIWRIQKIDASANPTTITWACIPASPGVLAKFAGFEHIWDDRAALTYM